MNANIQKMITSPRKFWNRLEMKATRRNLFYNARIQWKSISIRMRNITLYIIKVNQVQYNMNTLNKKYNFFYIFRTYLLVCMKKNHSLLVYIFFLLNKRQSTTHTTISWMGCNNIGYANNAYYDYGELLSGNTYHVI